MNVLAGGKIHHGIPAPADAPDHLFHLLVDGGGDGGVAQVAVDLHQEIPADDHRLQFRVIDVGWNDGPPARHLVAHEFGGDPLRDGRAEGFPRVLPGQLLGHPVGAGLLQPLVLPDGDEFHLRRDDALPGIVHLGDVRPGACPPGFPDVLEPKGVQLGVVVPNTAVPRGKILQGCRVLTGLDPGFAKLGEPAAEVNFPLRVGIGTGRIVDRQGRIGLAPRFGGGVGQVDFPHGDADIRTASLQVNLPGVGQRPHHALVELGGVGEDFLGIRAHIFPWIRWVTAGAVQIGKNTGAGGIVGFVCVPTPVRSGSGSKGIFLSSGHLPDGGSTPAVSFVGTG